MWRCPGQRLGTWPLPGVQWPSGQGLLDRKRPLGESGMSVHIPTLPDAALGIETGGSLSPRTPVPALGSRLGGRGATEIWTTTCEVTDVHLRIAAPRTCTPISHVRFWIGIGHVANRLLNHGAPPHDREAPTRSTYGSWPTRFRQDPRRPNFPAGGEAVSPRAFGRADRAVHLRGGIERWHARNEAAGATAPASGAGTG